MKERWVFPNFTTTSYEYSDEIVRKKPKKLFSSSHNLNRVTHTIKKSQNSQVVNNFKMGDEGSEDEHEDKFHIKVETMVFLLVFFVLFCTICLCVSNHDNTQRSNISSRTWSLRPKNCQRKDVLPGNEPGLNQKRVDH